MTGLAMSALAGLGAGSLATALLGWGWARARTCSDPEVHVLTDADREVVAGEFAAHAEQVRVGLSEYGDLLAGGDTKLRERLRLFEGGGRP